LRPQSGQRNYGKALMSASLLLVPVGLVMLLWSAHTYHLMGKLVDSANVHFVTSADDPLWKNGGAVGRIPSFKDVLFLPAIPALTGIFGQLEPYGGRTGLVLLPGLIALFCLRKRLPREHIAYCKLILLAAACYFFLLGPFIIKTRYHIFVWAMLYVLSAVGFTLWYERSLPLHRRFVALFFCCLVVAGMVDCSHVLLRSGSQYLAQR
jgi:hypothetical protein